MLHRPGSLPWDLVSSCVQWDKDLQLHATSARVTLCGEVWEPSYLGLQLSVPNRGAPGDRKRVPRKGLLWESRTGLDFSVRATIVAYPSVSDLWTPEQWPQCAQVMSATPTAHRQHCLAHSKFTSNRHKNWRHCMCKGPVAL